jgi:hypothetical protein
VSSAAAVLLDARLVCIVGTFLDQAQLNYLKRVDVKTEPYLAHLRIVFI